MLANMFPKLFLLLVMPFLAFCQKDRNIVPAQGPQNNRIALVIGNAAYLVSPLKNPVHDADSMASVLKYLGFDVYHFTDLRRDSLLRALQKFGAKLNPKSEVVFYYSGHGVCNNQGENYMVPIDAEMSKEADIDVYCVPFEQLNKILQEAGTHVNILMFDACRNKPFRGQRNYGGGLAPMNSPQRYVDIFCHRAGASRQRR